MTLLRGADRATPWSTSEVSEATARGYDVLAYYLPSPYADRSYTLAEAQRAARAPYVLPIYVPRLALPRTRLLAHRLAVADARRALAALDAGYPCSGRVALDIEAETTGNVAAYVSRWCGYLRSHYALPLVYGNLPKLDFVARDELWLASWVEGPSYWPVTGRGTAGWQWASTTTATLGEVDLDLFDSAVFDERKPTTMGKYTVLYGDSWERIAQTQGVPVEGLRAANPDVQTLRPGDEIELPAAAGEAPSPEPPAEEPPKLAPVTPPPPPPAGPPEPLTPPQPAPQPLTGADVTTVYNAASALADALHTFLTTLAAVK